MSRRYRTRSSERQGEEGYTLAALLVILTILAVVVAYTVPDSWTLILQRERDIQTQFVMKQYARAIMEYQRRNGALPVSLEQLEKQTMPRVLRRPWPNPLSGENDWLLVPPGQAQQPGAPGAPPPIVNPQQQPGMPQSPTPSSPFPQSGTGTTTGPFVGVRPPQQGEAVVPFNDRKRYEEWMYTILDLQQEMTGGATPPGGPVVNPQQGDIPPQRPTP